MLASIKLQNYRCFEDHTVPLTDTSVIVGKNNAGKSTLVEALSLVALVTSKLRNLPVRRPPESLGLPDYPPCFSASFKDLNINLGTLFHRYREPPAIITARFRSGHVYRLYMGAEPFLYATVQIGAEAWILSPSQARKLGVNRVFILPQVAPLQSEERILKSRYVLDSMDSRLSSLHFRNQIYLLPEHFANFRELAEATWPGLRVMEPEETRADDGVILSLFIRDHDFEAEIGTMGHGLQMWLQTMWFLARTPPDATVILDEPDVYMHPDLQRKLYRVVRARFTQTIIATHSVEIMAEAEPREILVIDRRKKRSRFTDSNPAVQRLVDQIGGIHNVHLARLWSSRRFVLIEGKDLGVLREFYTTLFSEEDSSLDAIPNMAIGGWGGWNYAIGSSMAIKNNVGEKVQVYCVLDSDYHTREEIDERFDEAKGRGLNLHIWQRKELENYLLVPSAIRRVVASRIDSERKCPTAETILDHLESVAEELRETIAVNLAEEILRRDRKLGLKTSMQRARRQLETSWQDPGQRIAMVPGKEVLSRVANWSKSSFDVSFGAATIAKKMTAVEIPTEIQRVLAAIRDCQPFS